MDLKTLKDTPPWKWPEDTGKTLLGILGDQQVDESDQLRGKASISLGPALEHASTMGFEDADDLLISEEAFLEIQQSLRKLFFDALALAGEPAEDEDDDRESDDECF